MWLAQMRNRQKWDIASFSWYNGVFAKENWGYFAKYKALYIAFVYVFLCNRRFFIIKINALFLGWVMNISMWFFFFSYQMPVCVITIVYSQVWYFKNSVIIHYICIYKYM